MISYAMWAFQDVGRDTFGPVVAASVIPFLIVMLQYGLQLARGSGESPEHLLRHDRMLLIGGSAWGLMLFTGLYLA
jgi:hypothetical protein